MTDDQNICKKCKNKSYRYDGNNLKVDICYRCGYFICDTNIKNDELIYFLVESPEVIPYLIKMEYPKPTN